MKQSKLTRIMCLMLAAVMISSMFVSHTLSRFSDVANSLDTSRVAIWDINANEVTMELFKTSYIDEGTGNILAKSYNGEKIIAPGTSGTSRFSIVNHVGDIAPEVMYYIQIDLDDSNVSNDIITNQYIQWKLDNGSWGTWDQLKQSIYMLTGDPSGIRTYQAGEFANAFKKDMTHSISWQWLEEDIDFNTMTDEEDYIAEIAVKVTARQTSTVYGGAVEGANNIVNVNETIEPVVIKSSAPMNELVEVQVNGETLEREVDYIVTEGSTIITLTESYLKTLPIGGYNISIVSQKQVATAKLDIVDRVYTKPGTGGGVNSGIVHNGIIPEGGVYYVGVPKVYKSIFSQDVHEVGVYDGYTAKYEAGDNFPSTVSTGDIYVYGDYEYRYNQYFGVAFYIDDTSLNGWGVRVLDDSKTEYGEILTTINNKDVVSLNGSFDSCINLVNTPEIPNTVKYMNLTFGNCTSLVNVSTIPNSVVSMNGTFAYSSFNQVINIPNSVKILSGAFAYTNLTTAPVIPSGVENIMDIFEGCGLLTGEVEINANPTSYGNAFGTTVKPITLIGSSDKLNEIAATSYNGNVTVGADLSGGEEPVVPDVPVNNTTVHNNVIPQGGTYYQGVTGDSIGDYTGGTVYNAGQNFPSPQTGDVYVYGDYEYRYNMSWYNTWHAVETLNGWDVKILDKTKFEYDDLLVTINGKDLVSMSYTFMSSKIEVSPVIPNSVIYMEGTFKNCQNLIFSPVFPENLLYMTMTFEDCINLESVENIPNSVVSMWHAFAGCILLENVPAIPESVKNLSYAFAGCENLKTIEINANPEEYDMVIFGSGVTSITGSISAEMKNLIAELSYVTLIPSEEDMITFFVDGVSYEAEEGMTWGDWIVSDYNTDNFSLSFVMVVRNKFGSNIINNDGSNVVSTNIIISNYVYGIG